MADTDSIHGFLAGKWRKTYLLLVAAGVVLIFATNCIFGVQAEPGQNSSPSGTSTSSGTGQDETESADRFSDRCTDRATPTVAWTIIDTAGVDYYPVARRILEAQLRLDPANECAGVALAKLTDAEKAAAKADKAAAEADQTWVEARESDLTDWAKSNSTPLGKLLTTCLGVLVLLLVVTRLLTGVVVPPKTRGPQARTQQRNWIRGAGLALITFAALGPLMLSTGAAGPPDIAAAVSAWVAGPLVLMTFFRTHEQKSKVGWRRAREVVVAGWLVALVYVLVGLFSTADWLQHRAPVSVAVAAVVGTYVTAFASGIALRVRVQVSSNSGDADVANGHLLIDRLQRLGSGRPAGLRAAEGADVTSLPEEALTSVPTGALASLLFNVLRVIRPAAPWAVDGTISTSNELALTVKRNNRLVDSGTRTFASRDILRPTPTSAGSDTSDGAKADGDKGSDTTDELLTAAAAQVLITLTDPYEELKDGLCGADTWKALAAHNLASRCTDADRRKLLLEAAVDANPQYLLARLSLLDDSDTSDSDARLRYAQALDGLWNEFKQHLGAGDANEYEAGDADEGWRAGQLRMLFTRAVEWFNVRTDRAIARANQDDDAPTAEEVLEAWEASARCVRQLLSKLDPYVSTEPALGRLKDQMELPGAYLVLDLHQAGPTTAVVPTSSRGKEVAAVAAKRSEIVDADGALQSDFLPQRRYDHYALACVWSGKPAQLTTPAALTAPSVPVETGTLANALTHLEVAATDTALKAGAAQDPSFARLNGLLTSGLAPDSEDVKHFKRIILDKPPSDPMSVGPWKDWSKRLHDFGITRLDALARLSAPDLTARLRISQQTAQEWIDAAGLYTQAVKDRWAGNTGAGLELLLMLLAADVTNLARLRDEVATTPRAEALLKKLQEGSYAYRTSPRQADIDAWKEIPNPAPAPT